MRLHSTERAIIALLVLALVGCSPLTAGTTTTVPRTPTPPPVGTKVGDRAPDLELVNLYGESVRLSDFKGQPVMINFWATWCGFCLLEMPEMQEAYAAYNDQGFVILAIDVREGQAEVSEFANELGLTFSILFDTEGEVTHLFQVRGLPTSYFVDREGVIIGTRVGPVDRPWIDEHVAQTGIN